MSVHDPSEPTDEDLARKAQGGCRQSFEQLVRRFQVPLLRFLRRRVVCDSDAEDLLQETFCRAYERLDQYRDAWRFSTWLFTIGHRLAVSHHRSETSEQTRREALRKTAGPAFSGGTPGPGDALAAGESRKRLWDVAARVLSEEQFAAVWLYYVEGMDTRELTQVLDRSWVSVKTMLFRARAKLMPFLRDWVDPDSPPARRPRRDEDAAAGEPIYRQQKVRVGWKLALAQADGKA